MTNFPFDIETVELAIKSLKLNKAAGHDGIVPEHIVHSHPALVIHLKILFSMILKTGHVPDDFGKDIVIPKSLKINLEILLQLTITDPSH